MTTNKNIYATNTDGTELKVRKFDSTPNLTATHITHQNLLEDQTSANDARELIEDIEKLLDQNIKGSIRLENGFVPINRESMIKAFIYSLNTGKNFGINSHRDEDRNFAETLESKPDAHNQRRNRWEAFKKFVPARAIQHITSFNENDIKSVLYDFIQYQTFMNIDISRIFYRYFREQQDNAYRCATQATCLIDKDFINKYGRAPWDEVNELLKKNNFRHQVIPPSKEQDPRAANGYIAEIISDDENKIQITELSSGEKVIIALLLSAYAAQQQESRIIYIDTPDLILFDELDAHLHPSMTRMMFDVLQRSIIEKLSSQIIISTHSPTTVALAPSGSVFRLKSGRTHKLEHTDTTSACRDLSDGFIQVMDNTQIVIVEGKNDPLFYRAIESALRTAGQINNSPPLHFIAASKKDNPSDGGGAKAAEDWATKLNEAKLSNVHALLDSDGHRKDKDSIKILDERHSIENFILDPLSIAITLITDGKLNQINESIGKKFPQVSNIYESEETDIQALVNEICGTVEAHDPSLKGMRKKEINYIFGKALLLPEWTCEARGKDLAVKIRESFKKIDNKYIITKNDQGNYNTELGSLLKLWSQHPQLFPVALKNTLIKFNQ